jgi:hypothetical protein
MSKCNRYDELCDCSECDLDRREFITRAQGLHVGLLTDDELAMFEQCVKRCMAYRSYEGPSGLLGMPKVAAAN